MNEEVQVESYEINLMDIFGFLRSNFKYIVSGGLVGLIFSVAYIVLTPNKYEARWDMQMAQYVYVGNVSSIEQSGTLAANIYSIEQPGTLAERLRSPTAYHEDVRKACSMPEEFGEYLSGTLKVDLIKNSGNTLRMKLTALSAEQAKSCAGAVSSMIIRQQRALIEERMAGKQQQLAQYKRTLKDEQTELERLKKTEASNFGYLVKFGQLSALRARIVSLQEELLSSQLRPAKLISPIYVPSKPVSPKVTLVLLLWITLGVMLGFLSALFVNAWRGSKWNN